MATQTVNDLQTLADMSNNSFKNEIMNFEKSLSKDFANSNIGISLARIPEAVFIRNYLPTLAILMLNGEENDDTTMVISNWFIIAGSPYNSVNIVSDTNNNEIILTVPPIMGRIANDNNTNSIGYSDIITKYTLEKDRLPVAGNHFLNSSLKNSFNTIGDNLTTDGNSIVNQWIMLFKRYDIIKLKNENIDTLILPTLVDDISDDLEY